MRRRENLRNLRDTPILKFLVSESLRDTKHIPGDVVGRDVLEHIVGVAFLGKLADELELSPDVGDHPRARVQRRVSEVQIGGRP